MYFTTIKRDRDTEREILFRPEAWVGRNRPHWQLQLTKCGEKWRDAGWPLLWGTHTYIHVYFYSGIVLPLFSKADYFRSPLSIISQFIQHLLTTSLFQAPWKALEDSCEWASASRCLGKVVLSVWGLEVPASPSIIGKWAPWSCFSSVLLSRWGDKEERGRRATKPQSNLGLPWQQDQRKRPSPWGARAGLSLGQLSVEGCHLLTLTELPWNDSLKSKRRRAHALRNSSNVYSSLVPIL